MRSGSPGSWSAEATAPALTRRVTRSSTSACWADAAPRSAVAARTARPGTAVAAEGVAAVQRRGRGRLRDRRGAGELFDGNAFQTLDKSLGPTVTFVLVGVAVMGFLGWHVRGGTWHAGAHSPKRRQSPSWRLPCRDKRSSTWNGRVGELTYNPLRGDTCDI